MSDRTRHRRREPRQIAAAAMFAANLLLALGWGP